MSQLSHYCGDNLARKTFTVSLALRICTPTQNFYASYSEVTEPYVGVVALFRPITPHPKKFSIATNSVHSSRIIGKLLHLWKINDETRRVVSRSRR